MKWIVIYVVMGGLATLSYVVLYGRVHKPRAVEAVAVAVAWPVWVLALALRALGWLVAVMYSGRK